MFSNMTYENVLNDMLSRVTNDIDKREGSPIYMALAPCAYKLAETYFMLNNFVDLFFIDTAVGEYLDRICLGYGLERKKQTKSLRKIETTGIVDIGTRFSYRDTSYIVTEKLTDTSYIVECEQFGEVGNLFSGELENIDNISVNATLTDVLKSGEDTETDENLRNRLYIKIQLPSTSGNIYDYMNWALEVEGVGNAKVFPLWNGPGTVKIVVIDTNMEIDPTLEEVVFNHIEIVRPIGADITVTSPTSLDINIAANVVLSGSKTLAQVQTDFENSVREYLKSIVFKGLNISYARIGSILIDVEGINDYTNLLLNGSNTNIVVSSEEVAEIDTITLSEV